MTHFHFSRALYHFMYAKNIVYPNSFLKQNLELKYLSYMKLCIIIHLQSFSSIWTEIQSFVIQLCCYDNKYV
jgi:hypothetical protein